MIDLTEILKNVPIGTELQCLLFKDPVTLYSVAPSLPYPITVTTSTGEHALFSKEGYYSTATASQNCMIYPPMMNSWDNVEYIPDGKLVVYEKHGKIIQIGCAKGGWGCKSVFKLAVHWWYDLESHKLDVDSLFYFDRQITELEELKVRNLLVEEGYKMVGTELKVVSKFKEGDIIVTDTGIIVMFDSLREGTFPDVVVYKAIYYRSGKLKVKTDVGVGYAHHCRLATEEEKNLFFNSLAEAGYEFDGGKVRPKQITFKHFEPVIVRDSSNQRWVGDFFQYMEGNVFVCTGSSWHFCLPYNNDTKHLIGTSMPAPTYYR